MDSGRRIFCLDSLFFVLFFPDVPTHYRVSYVSIPVTLQLLPFDDISIIIMETIDNVIKYIEGYSGEGVELHSKGDEELVINMPAIFASLTPFVEELHDTFGVSTRLEYKKDRLQIMAHVQHLKASGGRTTTTTDTQHWITCNTVMLWLYYILLLLCFVLVVRSEWARPTIASLVQTSAVFLEGCAASLMDQ